MQLREMDLRATQGGILEGTPNFRELGSLTCVDRSTDAIPTPLEPGDQNAQPT
jgi:hypothetical protein